ncbi:MAG: glutamate--tRNA ligase [Alphaproteobacteria bacterium]|jgi:glutamyl-tRNA synthetase|nr:glutamate--tRNA ligase [Alphaproteobacteria bacterium]MBT4085753.1 glutamate--tRNA ligase [Alphaproteobacteria bacterium]MBT4543332.1 glutamate--tRNA ligase [Alphaproteobacteria bacterium]MBT7747179.1 glutamate--tRNA ligase [Alphaproteobacteria bacterium]
MTVITRFAPSPTGFLHIGGARTALFNWLYARHHGGQFRLRIEDTDRARSTPEAMEAIVDGMQWLGLDWDGEVVYQSQQADRHAEVARQLLADGNAYYCYCTPEELAEMREKAKAEGRSLMYDGRWRDRDPSEAPASVDPVVRLKAPQQGETIIEDQVQGNVKFKNDQLDDMVLLRGDGTPTYMLSVVVDDHDMGISHIMRGDDHLNNAARQAQLYKAMGWDMPVFGHIPLIHGADGAKLSKRHGALGIEAYKDMGYLPEAIRNHLLRLGWGHGDDEFISTEQAIEWFDVDGLGKSPSRFDFKKLDNINGYYIRQSDDQTLINLTLPGLSETIGRDLGEVDIERLTAAMPALKERGKSIPELVENAIFLTDTRPLEMDEKSASAVAGDAPKLLAEISVYLKSTEVWDHDALDACVRQFATDREIKFGMVAQPLRAALTGRAKTPGIFDVLTILGKEESLARVADISTKQA